MKTLKLLVIAAIMVGLLGVVGTAKAQSSEEVSTGAHVPEGSGNPPIVKAKWETPDEDPTRPWTQVFPPVSWNGTKTITYWAIVTDLNGIGNLRDAYVDVYHPDGSFKYQVPLGEIQIDCTNQSDYWLLRTIEELTSAYNHDLVTFGTNPVTQDPFTLQEVIDELKQCSAKAYRGEADIDFCQMCGEKVPESQGYPYTVSAYAFDNENGLSDRLENNFEYICVAGIELDFESLDYEEVMVQSHKWIEGDYIWDEPIGPACRFNEGCRPPTIRNIGNIPVTIDVWFSDMDFGKTLNDWNVQFDARLGLEPVVYFDPEEWAKLPGTLELCEMKKISFSILVKKAFPDTEHSGTAFIEPDPVSFPWWV